MMIFSKGIWALALAGTMAVASISVRTLADTENYGYQEESQATVVCSDAYLLKLYLKVPQVVDNTLSLGKRIMRSQKIEGYMYVNWLSDGTYSISYGKFTNKSFKIGGAYVTYDVSDLPDEYNYPTFTWIGSNKTGKFTTPCIRFRMDLYPSYAKGEPTNDNSLLLDISGYGTSKTISNGVRVAKSIKGKVSGNQGCGCMDYGHKSPTRMATMCGPGSTVRDVVSTSGVFYMKFKGRYNCN